MTIGEFCMIALGELLLAATFALGVLVGVTLTRKDAP